MLPLKRKLVSISTNFENLRPDRAEENVDLRNTDCILRFFFLIIKIVVKKIFMRSLEQKEVK